MKNLRLRISLALCLLCILFTSCALPEAGSRVENLPYYSDASFTPQWLEADDAVLEKMHQIPAFELTNQNGEAITEKTVEGKVYVVDFFFTSCPGICPKMTTNMSLIQQEFLEMDDVLLLSHSVTPQSDSVSVLKNYAEGNGIDSKRWHLLTGDRKEIYDLGRKAYWVEEDLGLMRDESEFLHTENFILVDQQRHIRGIYNGLNLASIQQLIADIYTLRKEA